MQLFKRVRKINQSVLMVAIFVAMLLSCFFIITYSVPRSSTAWDGVVATSFTSGTGTDDNPYVISSAGEFAYLKSLLEGGNSALYLNKKYLIANDFNYGNHEMSINTTSNFTGEIDGGGHTIENAKITNYLFYRLNGATIKNIALKNINYTLNSGNSGVVAQQITNSNFEMIILEGNATVTNSSSRFGGFTYSDNQSNFSKIVINYNITSSSNYKSQFMDTSSNSRINYLLTKQESFNEIRTNGALSFNNVKKFQIVGGKINLIDLENLDDYQNDDYAISLTRNKFILGEEQIVDEESNANDNNLVFSEQASGKTTNTVYVNDLTADWNYYYGYNYASSSNGTLPSGNNRDVYNSSNLVKVMISYSGVEVNNGETFTGTISKVAGEAQNKIVYYKWIPVSNNKITIELIDNPFTNRPNGKGFNNWISDTNDVTLSFDYNKYKRYATVSVTPSEGGGYTPIALSFHASWIDAQISNMTGTWSTVFDNFYAKGLRKIDTTDFVCDDYNMTGYYLRRVAPNGSRYTGYLSNGQSVNNRNCRTSGGCEYFILINNQNFDPNTDYYYLAGSGNNRYMTLLDYTTLGITCDDVVLYDNLNVEGLFEKREFSYNTSYTGYYDINGNQVSGTCNQSSCTYYEFIQSFDELGLKPEFDIYGEYYYLVTRDTNIAYLAANVSGAWSSSENKPFTFTGLNNGTTSPYRWNVNNTNVYCYNDTAIENMTIYSENEFWERDPSLSYEVERVGSGWNSRYEYFYYANLIANYHNLKVGRGLKQYNNYTNFDNIIGGTSSTGSNSSDSIYNMTIESGFYDVIVESEPPERNTSDTLYIQLTGIFGNDYDRVTNNNNNLLVSNNLNASLAGNTYSSQEIAYDTYIKSGKFGSEKFDMYSGIYVGGRTRGNHYAAKRIKIEGGWVYNVIGGPTSSTSMQTKNDTYIYQTGGEVDMIIAGAGRSPTYGNRIISLTGGKVNYSVFGGSNGSGNDTVDGDGTLVGTTFIYVGGNSVVGDPTLVADETASLWGAEPGSVFGIGNGKSGSNYTQIGSCDNSNIIIDGQAQINKNVYGGGNFGATGVSSSNTTTYTNIKILGGTIAGSVYGGGNRNGSGDSSTNATINITMTGGEVKGSIYGGSNKEGTIYGNTNVNVLSGTVRNNVYGGGEGSPTYVKANSNVVIGATTANQPAINGNVYGGSAFGTVNATTTNGTATGNTTVTVNNGVITGSVFGGGEGDREDSITPHVQGNITVTINGGDITNVFGGHDQMGTFSNTNHVYLNGGTIDSVFGGGNKSSVTTTNVHQQGSTVTTIYGGSNTLGDVTTTNVSVTAGTSGNVFGGNNEGGTCGTTNVTVQGTGIITVAVYGGGNEVNTTTTNVNVVSAGDDIPNVFGGGNSASVTTANVTQNGADVTNIFGGSNSSGSVNASYITHNSGNTDNIYGGNNEGGNTVTSNITYVSGTTTNIYGGGNEANGGTSNVTIQNGTINNIFGGGNSAGLTTSNVTVTNGNIDYIYGGSNTTGLVSTTNVTFNNGSKKVLAIYGGGNEAEVGSTNVTINNGIIEEVYGGGNLATAHGNTRLDINGGIINSSVYGGGNYGVVEGNSNVTITNATILGSAYAGGNGERAVLKGNTNITIDGNTTIGSSTSTPPSSGCVFGGGNKAATGQVSTNNSVSTVNIVSGTINGNVYGGANTSVIYGNTIVNIGTDAVNQNGLVQGNLYVKGHVFGGGEANASGSPNYDWFFISVTQGTHINVDANGYNNFTIDGSFYGGGNASSASGDSYLSIKNYGSRSNPKHNISIQRVTYATLDNSSMLLSGAIDRANDYDTELFSISRVDKLVLKNNSELFLETGANLLKRFESLDEDDEPAEVEILAETKEVNKSVDNRLYMYEGRNLNIALDQQVTEYGTVIGMTFLGQFNYANNTVNIGNYNPIYDYDDLLSSEGEFSKGSYVLGAHVTDHDIEVDGFYSNFMDAKTKKNEVKYIDPTPADALFYMWYIGENVLEINVNLVASKYSTLGSLEVSFLEFSRANTSFEIDRFDSSDIEPGISLVDRNSIPRIAANSTDANSIFGLSLEASNTGWLTTGKTSFYTNATPNMVGTKYYEGENSTVVPTMLFYLYHSKNISEVKELGTARIQITATTKISALQSEISKLVINVHMSTALFQTTEYEGAMTPGDKYELFASTSNNITTRSKLSAYYSLYDSGNNIYRPGYHRVLASSFVFPENTKITMLNFINGVPEYYYYVITAADVTRAEAEIQNEGDCSYPLSSFTKMGSKSTNLNYDDAANNAIYYNGADSNEEFIFIVDFIDAGIDSDQLNNTLLIEMRDSDEESIITVLGIEHAQLTYNLYSGLDSVIDINVNESLNPLYIGYNDIFNAVINYQNSAISGMGVIDTQYFEQKLGLQIAIYNNENKRLSGTDLTGTYFEMDEKIYYPDITGITHIKLADKVGNTQKWIIFHTENSTIGTGSYRFSFEAFASPDGIYYSSGLPDYYNINMNIINSKYGLNPELDDNSVVFSSINDKSLKFSIAYTSLLDNPNIRIALYRREYDTPYDTDYELVDLADYVSQTLFATENENEYLLISNPSPTNNFTLPMEEELITGTYRISFRLYDGNTMIGEIIRYIIIK